MTREQPGPRANLRGVRRAHEKISPPPNLILILFLALEFSKIESEKEKQKQNEWPYLTPHPSPLAFALRPSLLYLP